MISTIYARMAIAEILAFGSAMLLIGALVTLYVKGTARLGCVPIALFAAAMFSGPSCGCASDGGSCFL